VISVPNSVDPFDFCAEAGHWVAGPLGLTEYLGEMVCTACHRAGTLPTDVGIGLGDE
jgi:hypothetical protein